MGRAYSTNEGEMYVLAGKRPLGRPRLGWADNIKMHLREIGWGGMDYTDLSQDRDQ
jgi:hypothetical protein